MLDFFLRKKRTFDKTSTKETLHGIQGHQKDLFSHKY